MIKAIETSYSGYRFRSRLEARWAVFLDSLGVKYRYEHQGYTLDGTPYLPDFFLPFDPAKVWKDGDPQEAGYWLEIKPLPPSEEEERLLSLLAVHTGHVVYCFAGDPWPGEFMIQEHRRQVFGIGPDTGKFFSHPKNKHPRECFYCDGSGWQELGPLVCHEWKGRDFSCIAPCECACDGGLVENNLNAMVLNLSLHWHGFLWNVGFAGNCGDWQQEQQTLLTAFRAARSARFEHGETPR